MSDNTCVCCGEPIPEGRQVCPKCEKGGDIGIAKMTLDEAIKICEEDAEKIGGNPQSYHHAERCRQLAEWLTELIEYREDDWKKVEEEMPEPWYIVLVWREIDTMEMATWARDKWLSENHSRPLSDVKYWRTLKIPKEERRTKNDT